MTFLDWLKNLFRRPAPPVSGGEIRITSNRPANMATTAKTIGEELAEILEAEEGVREIPRDSNRGKRVEEFQRATWLDGTGWPWCAAFICWGLLQIQLRRGTLPFSRPRTAGAWDFERWARQEDLDLRKPAKDIKRGDIVCFTFSHIGVAIEDERNGYVKTIEGNTNAGGSREGGGVYVQNRKVKHIRSNIRLG